MVTLTADGFLAGTSVCDEELTRWAVVGIPALALAGGGVPGVGGAVQTGQLVHGEVW